MYYTTIDFMLYKFDVGNNVVRVGIVVGTDVGAMYMYGNRYRCMRLCRFIIILLTLYCLGLGYEV